ncbi:helix-turn-helix domain-containing protein [Thalassospira sp. UBA1131]|uniref:helix-turn-helix domain-containing protein n=1 Tax=Thalassospira sp. UBA1131 TaxID=1947672 RepID=UPI0025E522CD|nr:helix-turn-helix transcriptional regulator [Thalassospira sp. UBA1131]
MFNAGIGQMGLSFASWQSMREMPLTKLVKFGTFKKVMNLHHVEVSMSRRKNAQIPLGELLTKARLEQGLSRAHVAKEAGVSENSLVRYEKAGLEDDGQFPPSPKLAALCFSLEISPLTALLSCLGEEEYKDYYMKTHEDWLMDHPAHNYVSEQWFALLRDNHLLRETVRVFVDPDKAKEKFGSDGVEWIKEEAKKVIEAEDAFEQKMLERKVFQPNMHGMGIPGPVRSSEEDPYDYAAQSHDYTGKKNGPDG